MTDQSVPRRPPEWFGTLAEVIGVGFAICALAVTFGFLVTRALDDPQALPGARLSSEQRAVIASSSCRKLWSLLPGYEANADSVEWGRAGVQAIVDRSDALACNPAVASALAD